MSELKILPVIRGSGGGGKSGGGATHVPSEAPDSLQSRATARVLDLLCEGEIEGLVSGAMSVYLDETPLQAEDGAYNFQNVALDYRSGTQDQSYIPGFDSQESEQSVDVEVKADAPVVRQITDLNATSVRVTLGIPGLSFQDPNTGDLSGTSVEIAVDIQPNGGAYASQTLGYAWSEVSVPTATGSLGPLKSVVGVNGDVSWQKPYSRVDNEGSSYYDFVSVEFNIEYRAVGAGSWTLIRTGSLTGRADGTLYGDGGSTAAFSITGLSEGDYEVRVVKTSGSGDVYLRLVSRLIQTGTDIISGKTRSRYQRSYRFLLTGSGPWNVRVRRITADSSQSNLQNKTFWDSYTEIIDAKLRYPNSAIIGIAIDATQFSSIPSRGYHVRLLRVRVPSNYDPIARTYSGVWDGTFKIAWTNNPAWCFYDLITTARYGLGDYIPEALADKWSLYQIAQYCDVTVPDGKGGLEPRFTVNVLIRTQVEAYKLVSDLASVFRGMVYWSAGGIYAVQDSPSDAMALFTGANVIDGEFTREGSGRKARHTVAVVTWNDPDDFYRQAPEFVEDKDGIARYGVRKTEVVAFGCTSQSQAHRVGRWLLYTEKYESEVVSWRAGLDAAYVRPGDIVKIVDPSRSSNRFGGRVVAATSTSVTLDSSVTLEAGQTYTLSTVMPDGTIEDRVATNGAGQTSVITFSTVLPSIDIVESIWILSATNLTAELIRVLSIVEESPATYRLTGLEHYSGKYDFIEQDIALQSPKTSDLTVLADEANELQGSEYLYKSAGSVLVRLVISWRGASGAVRYRVSYRRSEGNWITLPETLSTHVEIDNVVPGSYSFKVVGINALGQPNQGATSQYTVKGKEGLPPADVASLSVAGHELSWTEVSDLDLEGYKISYQIGAYSAGSPEVALHTGVIVASPWKMTSWPSGLVTLIIRAVDTSGNVSVIPATATVDFTPSDVTAFSIEGKRLSWATIDDADIAGYSIRYQPGISKSWGDAIPLHEGVLTDSPFTMPVSLSGQNTLMIKAVDASGNESKSPAAILVNLGDPIVANVVEQFDFQSAGWLGTLTGGSVVANDLVADSGTLAWNVNGLVLAWGADSSSLAWTGTFKQMTYEERIEITQALDGSKMTAAVAVDANTWSLSYRENSGKIAWDADGMKLAWSADSNALAWDLPAWLPWPGEVVVNGNSLYDFRLITSQGLPGGVVSQFVVTVDAPDINEYFNDVAISAGGTRLPITKSYRVIKNVSLTLQSGLGGAVGARVIDKNITLGPLVEVIDSAETAVDGVIDGQIQGY